MLLAELVDHAANYRLSKSEYEAHCEANGLAADVFPDLELGLGRPLAPLHAREDEVFAGLSRRNAPGAVAAAFNYRDDDRNMTATQVLQLVEKLTVAEESALSGVAWGDSCAGGEARG